MKPLTRRALLGGGAGVVAAASLEWLSLRGSFDHRKVLRAAAAERYAASRAVDTGIVHLAHSTHVIMLGGLRFLTDPWFYDPAFGALSHEVMPAERPDRLGPLDAILVTHDHADHADLRAMDEMDKRAVVFVATAELAARVRACGFGDVAVLAPWEERRLGDVVVTAVPGQHDIYEIGYVVSGAGRSVYFAGDTRLHPDLPAIAERLAPDVAILPVDGTRLTGGAMHVMTPADAAVAARILRAKTVMASHAEAWFSDPLAGHVLASTIAGAPRIFVEEMARSLPKVRCHAPLPGELVTI